MTINVILEKEQIDLLFKMIEGLASLPREQRIKFFANEFLDGTTRVEHVFLKGQDIETMMGDLEALHHVGFINLTPLGTGSYKFTITPTGRAYYDSHRSTFESPAERIEKQLRSFIDAENFRKKYPIAFDKWTQADLRLWADDSHDNLSVIGHLCREAMQAFVTVLIDRFQPIDVDHNKAHDIARLKSVIAICSSKIPTTLVPFLESLIEYWGTLSDLVQRQEHSGQKEGSAVEWEDARRVVFHTAIVFLEIDKTLSSIK